ncbi:MAG: DUF7487 domain-containing protein, partial [bacterium]
MILSKYVDIKIGNNLLMYYKNIGYDVNTKNIFKISVEDLPNNSGHKIIVKCDFCGKEKSITKNRYSLNTKNNKLKYACSRKCAEEKNKDTLLKKYNVDNISKLDSIKTKKIKTCITNNGVEHPQQSIDIYKKSKKTKNEKYKNENYNNKEKRID